MKSVMFEGLLPRSYNCDVKRITALNCYLKYLEDHCLDVISVMLLDSLPGRANSDV